MIVQPGSGAATKKMHAFFGNGFMWDIGNCHDVVKVWCIW